MSSAAIRTVLTGFALASSWTWCIGMFLPVLLGRMFGWPGILAFAIPNVLGCALFGFLRTRAQSQRETRDHALFMAIFSAATVAYQVFFVGWIVTPTLTATSTSTTSFGATIMLCGGFLAAAFALALLPRAWLWLLAAFAFPLSVLTFAFLPWESMHSISASGEWSTMQLAFVLPTIVFGFALSPNLDLTFHRARQTAVNPAFPAEFAVFGVCFASMLLLTTSYLASPRGLTSPAVQVHIVMQLVVTSALHLNELRSALIAPIMRVALTIAAAVLGLATALWLPSESTYLRYLGLYGLLFPAYALLALRCAGRPTRSSLIALLISVAVVVPILDHSFTDAPAVWAPLAVVLPVLAALGFARKRADTLRATA